MRKMLRRAERFAVLFVMVAALFIAAMPKSAVAATGNPSYCDADVPKRTNQNIGSEVPVILVHGMGNYNANANVWGSVKVASSFAGTVDRIPGVAVAHIFHYDTSIWVDQNSGPQLAKTIDCVSRLSAQSGGKGKVIIVGYSLGGLVAREALSKSSTDGQRSIASEVGQVITIGSPHEGANAPITSVYNPNSSEIRNLPQFPASTTVHTIAADITKVTTDFWNGQTTREALGDDTLVPISSALSGHTNDDAKGGGQKTVTCDKFYVNVFGISYDTGPAACEHGQLISNPFNGVRTDTTESIKKYVAWLNTPHPVETFTAGTITVSFDDRWENFSYGASGPDGDILGQDKTAPASVLITNMAQWCTTTMEECVNQVGWSSLGPAPAITVGGRTPDYSVRFIQPGHTNGSRLIWCFETEKVCIDYGAGTNINLEPSAALIDLLNAATWSS